MSVGSRAGPDSGGYVQRAGAHRCCGTVRGGDQPSNLLEIILKRRECLLGPLEVAGLERLRQEAELLGNRIVLRGGRGVWRAFRVVMVVTMTAALLGNLLEVLLEGRESLLGCGQIPRQEILSQLFNGLRQGATGIVGCAARLAPARQTLRQRGEILLGLTEIARLQILSQLLKFGIDLTEGGLLVLRPVQNGKKAACDSCD